MFLKDLLFPKFCLGCGFLGAYICHNCQKKLSYREKDFCLYCKRSSLNGFTHPICKRRDGIDGILSIFHYNNFLKTIIKSIKYRLATDVWKELCLVIKPESLEKLKLFKNLSWGKFYFEPIPLYPSKLRIRGFNQAKIIAQFFNQFLSCPLTAHLTRKKDTLSQAQLKSNQDRYRNMRGAFQAESRDAIKGKNFILVDDVLTTGSTLKEATRALKSAGAKNVLALVLAQG